MAKKKTKKKDYLAKIEALKKNFQNERSQFLIGAFLLCVSVFSVLAMISFFFSGDADQSKVLNKSFKELITLKNPIDNWMGIGGAYLSHTLINKWYGVASFAIPYFVALCGLKLMHLKDSSLIRSFILSVCWLAWGSVVAAFVSWCIPSDSHIVWGGSHGQFLHNWLSSVLGIPGLVMVIAFTFLIFSILTKLISVESIQNIFAPKEKTEAETHEEEEELIEEDIEPVATEKTPSWGQRIKLFFKKLFTSDEDESPAEESGPGATAVTSTFTVDNDEELLPNAAHQSLEDEPMVYRTATPLPTTLMDDDFEIVVAQDEHISTDLQQESVSNTVATESDAEDTDTYLGEEMEDYDPTLELSSFQTPSLDLLKMYDTGGKAVDMEEQRENKEKIITTLRNYGIEITSIKATIGPTITLYEIVPAAGVRISKIRGLADDIALSLSALGIRIIAPMPGKGTVGIEVPNKSSQIVSMQSVIGSKAFQETKFDLPVALGKTITNEVFMFDLCKMPHLLVAGATGQGKSVGLNAIITSLLYKKHPAEMKMVLIDPKMVEFSIYATIEKHYLAKLPDADKAIITDVTKVIQTLSSLTKEMDDRYELLMNANVRAIKEYNEKFKKRRLNPQKGHRYLPYIVVIIDEFADLIMQVGKEVEMPIARIAQKARAVGIHMVIATQRPTTNIITGTIKANFPGRVAFRVTSSTDSRTILDMNGAEQLIGRGDLLFSQGSDLVRVQCAFVDTPEVEDITQYIGNQRGYATAFELPEFVGETGDSKVGEMDWGDKDPLFEEAARLIVMHQQGSTSLIQRKFSIGYNRAGRLMDQMERAGIVGAGQGSKPREVLIMDEYQLEQLLSNAK